MIDNIITWLFAEIDRELNGFVEATYGALASHYKTALTAAATLMVVLWASGKLAALGRDTLEDFIIKVVLVPVVVITFATQWPVYSEYVYILLTDGTDELIQVVSGSSPWARLGLVFDNLMIASWQIINKGSLSAAIWWIFGALYSVAAIFMVGLAVYVNVAAKIIVALLMALAPVMFIFALFERLRPYTANWISAAAAAAFASVLVTLLVTLITRIIERPIADIALGTEPPTVLLIGMHLLLFLICMRLFWIMPPLAQSIFGGVNLYLKNHRRFNPAGNKTDTDAPTPTPDKRGGTLTQPGGGTFRPSGGTLRENCR